MSQAYEPRQRLAIMVNVVAPYRLPVYEYLARSFDVFVLHGGAESNRAWEEASSRNPHLRIKKTWSFKLNAKKKIKSGGVQDQQFIHFNLGAIWDLARFRPDVVIANEMGVRTLLAMTYGAIARVPVWIWWGGTMHSEKDVSNLKRQLRTFIAGRAKRWISYGATSTEYLESIGVKRQNILQIQNCVDDTLYQDKRSSPESFPARPAALIVGQLIARKGLKHLLESAARVQQTGRDFTLVFAGSGVDHTLLEGYASELGLKHIQFRGALKPLELRNLYYAADFMIFPTLEDVWGLVVNEAMLCGLPVLCSKYAGCASELVPPEAQFDPLDRKSFDAALINAIDGHLSPPELHRLKTCNEVGEMITLSLKKGLPTNLPYPYAPLPPMRFDEKETHPC